MPNIVVAIPVRDEAERIGACLEALASQRSRSGYEVLLLLNNCADDTESVVRALAPRLPIRITATTVTFPPEVASAGEARRLAMSLAAERAGPDSILMTTDADGRVAPDWVAANLAAIAQGAEAVAGRALIDPVEALAIPAHLHADDAVECTFAARLDEIDALVDPDPADPWPRHDETSGASLAVAVSAYRRAGGVPAVALGEDRAFVAGLRRVDAAIRHAPEITVVISGRLEGRARGGMADTMKRRITQQDAWVDDRLEPARDRFRRARLRARYRAARRGADSAAAVARELRITPEALRACLADPFAGTGWERVESKSPVLQRARVIRAGLGQEIGRADAILARLRMREEAAD